jgi:predicted nuclease of predicted toxin-antitoxin system
MKLYLDDDSADPLLARLLRNAGHDVRLPAEAGQVGSHDAVHLKNAIRESRVFLTANHDDFVFLHELIMEALGQHPGILVVRRDNNPKRDLTARGIARYR